MVDCECRKWCGPVDRTRWNGHHPNCPAIDPKESLRSAAAAFAEQVDMLPDGEFKLRLSNWGKRLASGDFD